MRNCFVFLLLFTTACCFSQDTTKLTNWKSYTLLGDPDTLQQYNWSPDNWVVYKKGKEVHAVRQEQMTGQGKLPFEIKPLDRKEEENMKGKCSVQQVDDGFLVGFWRGEWGGSLYWFAKDGIERYRISRHMVLQFIKRDNQVYAIAGLAHMGMSTGSMVEIKKVNNKWTAENWLTLPFAPYAAALDAKKNFIVITSGNLLRINPAKRVDTLISNGFWAGLYPTSVVIESNIAYAGMRKGVLKYNLVSGKAEWLLPE